MPLKRDEILEQLEQLRTAVVSVMDDNARLTEEGEELRRARREAEEKAWAAQEEAKSTSEELESLRAEHAETKRRTEELEAELERTRQQLEEVSASKDEEVEALRKERDDLKREMDEITSKLERVSELYRETAAEKAKLEEKVDVSDLLAIYIMLIETVFYGKPHARILYTLHNTRKPITRRNIASSTGIQPAVVQKAIFDLANAGLVRYDEDTQEVSLLKEIM